MRILTWTVQGDCGEGVGDERLNELNKIIEYWDKQENYDPVTIICLQEVNGKEGALTKALLANEWVCYSVHEQVNGGGRYSVIAVRPGYDIKADSNQGEIINLEDFRDPQGITSRPVRNPIVLPIEVEGQTVYIITWHATLGSRQIEDFVGLSNWIDAEISDEPVIIAADLNQTEDVLSGPYYNGFGGVSHHLDHILGRNIVVSNGEHSNYSSSDHLPISAHFA